MEICIKKYIKTLITAQGYKTFFMLNSAEHEILNAYKYKRYQEMQLFSDSEKPRMLFSCS